MRVVTDAGKELSGYIDYNHRLTVEDWKPFFKGQQKIQPKPSDLGFYHWGKRVLVNDSLNYKVFLLKPLILFISQTDYGIEIGFGLCYLK